MLIFILKLKQNKNISNRYKLHSFSTDRNKEDLNFSKVILSEALKKKRKKETKK